MVAPLRGGLRCSRRGEPQTGIERERCADVWASLMPGNGSHPRVAADAARFEIPVQFSASSVESRRAGHVMAPLRRLGVAV